MGMSGMRFAAAILYLVVFACVHGHASKTETKSGTADGLEEWGYVEVRPGAHMFWWFYHSPQRNQSSSKPWPIIMWLQGGPGGSGVKIGNFLEIGPLDENLKPRNSTWLQKADLLFVDNPVGTGFSYVDDDKLVVTSDEDAAADLTKLLINVFNNSDDLQNRPFFIVAESYGGKFAVTVGLAILKALEKGELKLKFGGVALGNSWISPEDFVLSWGPLLKDLSRLDGNAANQSNSLALHIKHQIEKGQYKNATNSWGDLQNYILENSNYVDFYNFLHDSGSDEATLEISTSTKKVAAEKYAKYLSKKSAVTASSSGDFMDGIIRKKLKIIPDNVRFGAQSNLVFSGLEDDFMKPRINEVDELLSKGVHVTVYSGQVDLICATKGAEAWLDKLRWEGYKNFTQSKRIPLYCGETQFATKAFKKSYKNLNFYWILGAGHFVPVDQPCVSLQMIDEITHSYTDI